MGKKTISLNLDDIGEDDSLISSILNSASSTSNEKKGGAKPNKKTKNTEPKEKKTLSLDLGNDIKPEISLSDIKIEKSKPKKRAKGKHKALEFDNSKMDKVAKLDDFLTISKDETANSLTHPKTKNYQVGKQDAELKLESIQTQIGKINQKISKKGRNNVDKRYIASLNKLLKKEDKYINILKSYSQHKNKLPDPDGQRRDYNNSINRQNNDYNAQYKVNKKGENLRKTENYLTPKTSNIISEIDTEMERVNHLLDLTEGKKGKYRRLKPETIYDTFNNNIKEKSSKQKTIVNGTNVNKTNKNDEFKNVNIGMDLDGVHYIPNMDINQLKNSKNNKGNKGLSNMPTTKKEITPPKTMFSVKANLLALKEREKMLAKQKRKIQEKLEFKKKQILKAKHQEKEMKKIKALEMEKRRLFELDREIKRLDKLRFQQSMEMKNAMKQMTQKDIMTQQKIDNIQKEEFIKTKHKHYQPFTYNFNTSIQSKTNNEIFSKSRSQSPTFFNKIHNKLMNTGLGEQVIFKQKPSSIQVEINKNKLSTEKVSNKVDSKVSNKGYKYFRKGFVDTNNNWLEWEDNHENYFGSINNKKIDKYFNINTNDSIIEVNVFPYALYYSYLDNYCLCQKDGFIDIITNDKVNSKKGDYSTNNEVGTINTLFKRTIYDKIPLDDRKSELCQYMGIIKKGHLDELLRLGCKKIVPLKRDNNKILLMKIWYSCFEDGKLFLSNGSNKIFSQKKEKIEEITSNN